MPYPVRSSRRRAVPTAVLGLLLLAAPAVAQGDDEEPVVLVPVLSNGGFDEHTPHPERGIPWWHPAGGRPASILEDGGVPALHLSAGAGVKQPCAAYAPLLDGAVLAGIAQGAAQVVVSGGGESVAFDVEARDWTPFEIDFADVLERAPGFRPRVVVELRATTRGRAAFRDVSLLAPMPCPSEEALREELLRHVVTALRRITTIGLDDFGPRETAFFAKDWHVETGEPLPPLEVAGESGTAKRVMRLMRLADVPELESWLERYLDDYFELCIHPDTGLERPWNPIRDIPLDDRPIEVSGGLGFLLRVADHGPEAYRRRALDAAVAMARTVLEHGVLPDGQVVAKYVAADASPVRNYPPIRRLDVPGRLATLAAAIDDPRLEAELLRVVRGAARQLEETYSWAGDWNSIDPGFDDHFGIYGAWAVEMWKAFPEEPVFQRIPTSGLRYYSPLWAEALRHGALIASDQVRAWDVAVEVARLTPGAMENVRELLRAAMAVHFTAQQSEDGAWRDTSFRSHGLVEVDLDDRGGVAQNLIAALGLVYQDDLGLRTAETRARITAVVRATEDALGAEYGFRPGRVRISAGEGGAGGSGRFAVAAIQILENLPH